MSIHTIQSIRFYIQLIKDRNNYKVICSVFATLGTPLADTANR